MPPRGPPRARRTRRGSPRSGGLPWSRSSGRSSPCPRARPRPRRRSGPGGRGGRRTPVRRRRGFRPVWRRFWIGTFDTDQSVLIPRTAKHIPEPIRSRAMPARPAPYLALRHRDYRRLVWGYLVSGTGSQMQSVAINWHVYLLTRSPLALGFVGLSRVVPIVVFPLWGGVLAARLDRRKLMIVTQSFMTAVAAVLALLTFTHRESLWLLYAMTACSSGAGAFDAPARQALIPRLVPDEDLPGALSLNFAVFQAGMIAGPALAGWLIAGHALVPGASGPASSSGHG